MTVHNQIQQPNSQSASTPVVAADRKPGHRGSDRSKLTSEEALHLLRQDSRYWDALCRQRDQADAEQSSFLAVITQPPISTPRLNELAGQDDEIEFQRVVGCDNKTHMIIASSSDSNRLRESKLEIPGTRFCYPQEPEDDQACFRLEAVFFKPTPRWKRIFDVLAAGLALLLLSPVLLVITLLIKIGSPGSVIFKQQRLGGAGEAFTIWKFRTLRVDCTDKQQDYVTTLCKNNSTLTKRNHDSALIPCGRFLRACCLDEIPQLFNVLQGSMSLVGPRPDVLDFGDYSSYQRRRFDVAPGMTGLWQVCGKNKTTFDDMIRFDVDYTNRRSFLFDLWILSRTLPALAKQYLEEETT